MTPDSRSQSVRVQAGKILFEATLAAVQLNPAVRETYPRLKGKGKPEKVARIAAPRKPLLIAHAVYHSGQPYRDSNASGVDIQYSI